MNVERWLHMPEEFPARLRWAGRLLVAGLLIELPTLFWPHTVSFFSSFWEEAPCCPRPGRRSISIPWSLLRNSRLSLTLAQQ